MSRTPEAPTRDEAAPQVVDAERSVLAAMLLEAEAVDRAGSVLTRAAFYRTSHGLIFDAMLELRAKREPVDLITLSAALKARGDYEAIGGAEALALLLDYATTTANMDTHAGMVAKAARSRDLIKLARQLASEAASGADPSDMAAAYSLTLRGLSAGIDPTRSLSRFADAATPATELTRRDIPPKLSLLGDKALTAGGFGILYGKPGLGKSWLAIELALAIVRGADWLGIPTHASGERVGLIQLELPDDSMQSRLKALLVGEHPMDDNLRVVCRPDLRGVVDLCRPSDFDSLRDWIERDSLKLVVLDAFSRAHSASENKAEEVNAVLAGIDAVRHDTGCAFLLVHHERKSMSGGGSDDDRDALRGSSRFQSDPTLLVRVKATSGGLKAISFVKISEGPDIEDVHVRTSESGFPIIVPGPESVADGNRSKVLDAVMRKVAPVSQGELSEALGMNPMTVKRHLSSLVSDGKVVRTGQGRGTRYTYGIGTSEQSEHLPGWSEAATMNSKELWDSATESEQ